MKKVGIIGLGYWYGAFRLARAIRDMDKAELTAVACPDRNCLEKFTNLFPMESYLDYKDLLARKDIDIVMVVPPSADIPEYAIASAKAGKHLIIAARMAMNLKDADRVVEAVRKAGIKCISLEGEAMFDDPGTRKKIRDGLIGNVIHITSSSHSSIPEDWYLSGNPGWFADPGKVPGGAFLDYAVYTLHALRLYAGSEVKEVNFAKMNKLIYKELDVEDWGYAFLTFDNDITATIETSWTIVNPKKTKPSPKRNSCNRIEVMGTSGRIITDIIPYNHELILSRKHPYWAYIRLPRGLMTLPAGGPMEHPFLDNLIECIDKNKQTVCTCEDARNSLKVILAAYESARKGKPVLLSEFSG